jgi:formate dehydrogenase major subunit
VDPAGRPWSPKRWVISWNAEQKKWEGDVPDGGWPPGEKYPFIMKSEGFAELFTAALKDGPFPEHYEPLESPIRNPLSSIQVSPVCKIWRTEGVDLIGTPERFPIVATTYRVSEHWQAGAMTRNLPWLCELIPDAFVEIGRNLAIRKGIKTGDRVIVRSARGEIDAYALVTERFEPFWLNGRMIDQVGIPWHFGYTGLVTGESANVLTPHAGDANTMIPEYKAFLCDLEKKEVV